jgi:hypothetical protein
VEKANLYFKCLNQPKNDPTLGITEQRNFSQFNDGQPFVILTRRNEAVGRWLGFRGKKSFYDSGI